VTLMIILGAVAALYFLRLLFRCAIFGLPIYAGLGACFHLHGLGYGWLGAIATGLMTGTAIYVLGRRLAMGTASAPRRFLVLLLFAGTAAVAGYQAGSALAKLAGFAPVWECRLAILAAFVAARASWRGLVGPAGLPESRGMRDSTSFGPN
jgi:hypothetical protein